MKHVLTLISSPTMPELDQSFIDTVRQRLDALGADVGAPGWLCPNIACELAFDGAAGEDAFAAARLTVQGWPIDVIVQADGKRRKQVLVADMDSTIVTNETLDEIAVLAGIGEAVARITERSMNGELDFREALRERMALLRDTPDHHIRAVLDNTRLTPGGTQLVRTMAAHGAITALVSGGFDVFTEVVAARVGFDRHRGNRLDRANGRLTGRVVEPVVSPETKLETLCALADERELTLADTMAVGDGANDLPMLLAAGTGIAFHPKPVVARQARHRIEHGDLTALLYAQGYHRDEFVDQE